MGRAVLLNVRRVFGGWVPSCLLEPVSHLDARRMARFFSSGADKFLQQYCTYCKKIWQSMAEIDLPVGLRLDDEQVLRGIFKSSLRAPLHNSFPSITRTEINIETP